jgi:hypothetical protein
MRGIPSIFGAILAVLVILSPTTASAQEKTGIKAGFTLKPGTARIMLMRPDVAVGEQSTGGMFEPNADWTAQARELLGAELSELQSTLGNVVVNYDESLGGSDPLVDQYSKLFGAVAGSVVEYQFFPGNRLPTKKRDIEDFDWGMGPGLANIKSLEGADYLLFVYTHDEYGSTGRKVLQLLTGVKSGVHIGYAGLIDLKTGQLVWLNADGAMGGDVRTEEGAQKRVRQLLEGFPGRPEAEGDIADAS